jgi:4-amino-4-deoxy-L-arabinose transferase-like glycosyltransferase
MRAEALGLSTKTSQIFDWLTASHTRALAVLALYSALCFLPGFLTLPPVDRDESRFAQASKQMLETGDYVDIRFREAARHKKPAGIYWLQAGAVRAAEAFGVPEARVSISVYRLPSLAGAIGTVLLTYWAALAFVSRRYALIAGLLMASSLLLGVEARLAKTDAMLTLTAVAAMGALARAYFAGMEIRGRPRTNGWLNAGVFWFAISGAILLKGPVVPFFVALAITALAIIGRSLNIVRQLKPVTGLLLTLALVLPWFIAVMGRSGGEFIQASVGQDLIGKLFTGQESHGAWPGYYWLLFWVMFWPAAPLAAMAADFAWSERWQPQVRFLIAWILPSWLVLEAVATKLPHYVLPLYPAIAILIAFSLEKRAELSRMAQAVLFLWPAMAALLGGVALFVAYRYGGQVTLDLCVLAALSFALALAAFLLFRNGMRERALAAILFSSFVTALTLYYAVPKASNLFLSPRIVAEANKICSGPQIASSGYNEPSLVFLGGTGVKFLRPAAAAEFLREPGCRVAAVSSLELAAFREAARGLELNEPVIVRGFNYSNGRAVELHVFGRGGAR